MQMNLVAFLTALTTPLLAQAQQPKPPVINGGLPSVSPSGDAIAFLSNRDGEYDVYVTTPDGSELMRITRSPAFERAPLWTGSRLVVGNWADKKSTLDAPIAEEP